MKKESPSYCTERELQHKSYRLAIVCIIALASSGAFALGRLSVGTRVCAGPTIVYEDAREVVVGSKNGNKYHFPWCPGAQRISATNLVTLENPNAALKAGYSAAANCKGLE